MMTPNPHPLDAMSVAMDRHEVLLENDGIRVLDTRRVSYTSSPWSLSPREVAHVHQLKLQPNASLNPDAPRRHFVYASTPVSFVR